jgi:hypothetical protein
MTQNNLSSGWNGDSILEIEYNGSITTLVSVANGSYITSVKEVKLPPEVSTQGYYLVLPLRTSFEASILLAIKDNNGIDNYLHAINPTSKYLQNAYSSDSLYELIFKIPEEINRADSIKIFATNFIHPEYSGILSFSFGSLSIFEDLNFVEENWEKIEVDNLNEILDQIDQEEIDQKNLFGLKNLTSLGNFTEIVGNDDVEIEFSKQSPTSYVVNANSTNPFVLVLSQSYDDEWEAIIGSEKDSKHFFINNFANAWIIDKSGSYQILLRYSAQNDVEIGRILSLFTIISKLGEFYLYLL